MSFKKLLTVHQPTHVLPAFDFGGHTWRHDLYPRYRENREPMPEVLRTGLPEFFDRLAEIGLKVISVPEQVVKLTTTHFATGVLRWLNERRC